MLGDNQIADTALVTVNVNGLLNLNGFNETLGALILNGGRVNTAAGTLTLNGDLNAASLSSGGQNVTAAIDGNLSLGAATRTFTVGDAPGGTDLRVGAIVSGATGVGLTKEGTGRMALTATNTYTGPTTVNAGILEVDGQLHNPVVVNNSGTLVGHGAVGPVTVNPGGDIGPGAGEHLSVNGNITFANSEASFTPHLVSNAAGTLGTTFTAALNNATLRVSDLGFAPPALGQPINVIIAGRVTGTFAGLANNAIVVSSSGLSYRVNYTSTSVSLTRINGPAFQQRAITSPIDEGSAATLTGHITTILPTDTFFLEVNWGDGSRTQTFRFGRTRPVTSFSTIAIWTTALTTLVCSGGISAAASIPTRSK